MSQEFPPPLRIRESDGTPNIPAVYEMVFSGATVAQTGPTRVLVTMDSGGSSVVYAATGNQYVTLALAGDLTAERVLVAGTGLKLDDAGANGNVTIQLVTPVSVSSGGTGQSSLTNRGILIGSGANAVQTLAAMVRGQLVVGSDSTLAPQYLSIGSHGQVLSVSTAGALGLIWADTSGGGGTTYAAETGLTLTAGSGFSVNPNIRDKVMTVFAAGALTTSMFAEEARVRIPFNMQAIRVDLAATTTASGAAIIVDINQHATPIGAGTSMFTNTANQPQIPALFSAGSATSFDAIGTFYTGSYLGIDIDQVGSTVAGSNLTITIVMRSS